MASNNVSLESKENRYQSDPKDVPIIENSQTLKRSWNPTRPGKRHKLAPLDLKLITTMSKEQNPPSTPSPEIDHSPTIHPLSQVKHSSVNDTPIPQVLPTTPIWPLYVDIRDCIPVSENIQWIPRDAYEYIPLVRVPPPHHNRPLTSQNLKNEVARRVLEDLMEKVNSS